MLSSMGFPFRTSPQDFKTRLLGRGFHTLIKNVSFSLPINMGSHNTLVGKENETFFIKVWKPLPSKRVLKTLRGSPKGKAQRGQYLLAVSLGYYRNSRRTRGTANSFTKTKREELFDASRTFPPWFLQLCSHSRSRGKEHFKHPERTGS